MLKPIGAALRSTHNSLDYPSRFLIREAPCVSSELEVEFSSSIPIGTSPPWGWALTHDDSLRNHGVEYVNTIPMLTFSEIDASLDRLFSTCIEPHKDFVVPTSELRSGYHVHVNAQCLTIKQLITNLVAYWMVESVLSHFCIPERRSNNFCVRLVDASGVIEYLQHGLQQFANKQTYNLFSNFSEQRMKYGAANLFTLAKFGTVEFRMLESQLDVDVLSMWTKAHYSMMYSTQFNSPIEVLEHYRRLKEDPAEFVKSIVGERELIERIAAKSSLRIDDLCRKELRRTVPTLLDFIYDTPDKGRNWETFFEAINERLP